MSVYADIRGAIQTLAKTASGFPAAAQIAYEGRKFSNTPETPYARMTLIPGTGGPLTVSGDTRNLRGMFQIDIYLPADDDPGTADIEAVADAVIALFPSGTRLKQNSTIVIIEYAQRAAADISEGWISIPVTIGWRVFAA